MLLTEAEVILPPVQAKITTDLLANLAAGHVFVLRAAGGMGKTTVLRWIQVLNDVGFFRVIRFPCGA